MSRLACVYVTTAHTTDRPHPPGRDNHTHIPTAIEPISLHDRTSDNEEIESKGNDQLEHKVIVEEGNQLDEGKEEVKEGMDDGVTSSQQRKRNRRKNKSSAPRPASDDGGELYECCVRGDVEEVRKLLESWRCLEEKEDDDERREEGRALPGSLLHAAVTGGHVEVVTALLECGVDPSVRYGMTITAVIECPVLVQFCYLYHSKILSFNLFLSALEAQKFSRSHRIPY